MNNRNETNNDHRNYANNRFNGHYDNGSSNQRGSANRDNGSRSDATRPDDSNRDQTRRETPRDPVPLVAVRESFSGRLLTDAQFDEAIAITGILEREVRRTGAFKDKLGDYAYAFARSEKFDAMKADTIVRDLFKERFGVTMNQMRENLAEREQKLSDADRRRGHDHALAVGHLIETAPKMSFHRAYGQQAQELGAELGVTDAFAKNLMTTAFRDAEKRELYDWGKELEELYYRPQIEQEKRTREGAERSNGQTQSRQSQSRRRPGPSGP